MSTRLYYSQVPRPLVTPPDAAWDSVVPDAGGVLYGMLMRNHMPTPFAAGTQQSTNTYRISFSNKGGTGNALGSQIYSEPLQAQTISGTVIGVILALQTSNITARSQCVIRVVDKTGQYIRGTLLGQDTVQANTWNISSTTYQQRYMPRGGTKSLTPVNCEDGDRLLVEIGARAGGNFASNSALVAFCSGTGRTDLSQSESPTITDVNVRSLFWTLGRSWLQFSQDLLFKDRSIAFVDFGSSLGVVGGGSGPAPVDETPPTVTPTPASGALTQNQSVQFVVEDADSDLASVVLMADFAALGRSEVVWNGSAFAERYAGSISDVQAAQVTLTVNRTAGWPAAPTFRAVATDVAGNVAQTSHPFTLGSIVITPEVAFTPDPGEISTNDPLQVDITDNANRTKLATINVALESGVWESAWDGERFTPFYVTDSTRVPIANGFRYTLRRRNGWPTDLTVKVIAFDEDGNFAVLQP